MKVKMVILLMSEDQIALKQLQSDSSIRSVGSRWCGESVSL